MRIRIFTLILLCSAVFVAGCDTMVSDGELVFRTDKPSYTAGDVVVVEVDNGLETEVGMNLCFAYLNLEKQLENGDWTPTHVYGNESENQVCTAALYLVQPGNSLSGTFHLPISQATGRYRITTDLELQGDRFEAETIPFVIASGP